jgi:hypothetical protein
MLAFGDEGASVSGQKDPQIARRRGYDNVGRSIASTAARFARALVSERFGILCGD